MAASLAMRFIDAIEDAFDVLREYPTSGSLRPAYELEIPELRVWSVQGSRYVVFYVDRAEHVDVWRVLHEHRDVPAAMAGAEAPTAPR